MKTILLKLFSMTYIFFIRAHQTHYEQMGGIKAKLSIDGKPYQFNGQAFRDHSYGKYLAMLLSENSLLCKYENQSAFHLQD